MNVRNVPQLDPSFFKVQEYSWTHLGLQGEGNVKFKFRPKCLERADTSCETCNKYCGEEEVSSWSLLKFTVNGCNCSSDCINMYESHLDLWNRPFAFRKGSLWGRKQSWFSRYPLILKGILAHALQPFCSNRPKTRWAESTVWLCPWWGSWSCYTVVCLEELKPCTLGWHFSYLFVLCLALHFYVLAAGQSLLSQQLY